MVAFDKAVDSMKLLNLQGAKLMQKYSARGATDVTGFGILGHADNIAKALKCKIQLHTLPVIANMLQLDKQVVDFKLIEGLSAETSGGLLIVLPET